MNHESLYSYYQIFIDFNKLKPLFTTLPTTATNNNEKSSIKRNMKKEKESDYDFIYYLFINQYQNRQIGHTSPMHFCH